MSTGRWGRWGGMALAVALAALFSYLNAAERVSLDLGVVVLYQVPLVAPVLLAFLLGMVTMFLVGLKHDLRVRRLLRDAGVAEPAPRPWEPDPPPGGAVP